MIALAALLAAVALACWPRRAIDLPGAAPRDRPPALARVGAAALGLAGPERRGDELLALRTGSLLAFGACGAAAAVLMGGIGGFVCLALLAAFGWWYPELRARSAARARVEELERLAPAALDLIASTVAAGVGIDAALAGAAGAVDGVLREELERTVANLALGRRRGEELRDLAGRTGSPSLARLAAALRISDRLGVPLAESLRRQARRARTERSHRVQEQAAAAGPRMLLVVVFVLVPAALLPVMTALGLTALDAVSGVGW